MFKLGVLALSAVISGAGMHGESAQVYLFTIFNGGAPNTAVCQEGTKIPSLINRLLFTLLLVQQPDPNAVCALGLGADTLKNLLTQRWSLWGIAR